MEEVEKGCPMIRMGVSGRMFLLVPAYLGSPGKRAVKRVCVRACVCVLLKDRLLAWLSGRVVSVKDGSLWYLVKWRDLPYDQATWEAEDAVVPELNKYIEEYYCLR